MRWFKKKPKPSRHELRSVAAVPAQHQFYRAVKCKNCNKQFIMDVFGGWSAEWEFKLSKNGFSVDQQSLEDAVRYKLKLPVREWIKIEEQECVKE